MKLAWKIVLGLVIVAILFVVFTFILPPVAFLPHERIVIGLPFAREYGGALSNRSFGGAQVSRTFYARGQTGQQGRPTKVRGRGVRVDEDFDHQCHHPKTSLPKDGSVALRKRDRKKVLLIGREVCRRRGGV